LSGAGEARDAPLGAVPGAFNLRDLGGIETSSGPVRPRLLLRSEALAHLAPEGRDALRRLGLRTAIDLREPIERELDRVELDAEVRAVPVLGGDVDTSAAADQRTLYREILERCGERIAAAARLLSEPDTTPALVFCSAGKDRTGLVCALVLSALGASDDDVAADYTLSEHAVTGAFRAELEARARRAGLSEQALAVQLGAPRELMLEVLADLRTAHGGAAAYLARHGAGPDVVEALRRALVDAAD
jgi:protein-tyrosine phosphatase